jgi:hypothetical protein
MKTKKEITFYEIIIIPIFESGKLFLFEENGDKQHLIKYVYFNMVYWGKKYCYLSEKVFVGHFN